MKKKKEKPTKDGKYSNAATAWMMKQSKEYGPEILEWVFAREDRIWRAVNDIVNLHKNLKKGIRQESFSCVAYKKT
jgi:hypothetical protein